MSIPTDAKPTPIDLPNANVPAVDDRGFYAMEELQRQTRVRNYVVGMGRIIPCLCASDTNVLTLTPNGSGSEDGEGPMIEGYKFGDAFLFWADDDSTGAVTATVVPKKGTLDTLKVYISDGATQANSGDVVTDSVYVAFYAPHLDSGAGGLVLK